jgi:uncharacterized tellurite resistance protein B-like protein
MSSSKELVSLQKNLTDKLLDIFDMVIQERQKYYQKNKKPGPTDIESIISSASNQNAIISGAASLVPGPWGMLAAIPEIVMVVRNHIKMIYDIGVASGKEKYLNRELLAGTVLLSMDVSGIGILTLQDGKYVVKRSSLQAFQKRVQMLVVKISQQLLQSLVAKWIPFVGSAAMASWSKFATTFIGKKAAEIFSKPMLQDDKEVIDDDINIDVVVNQSSTNFDDLKVYTLINLMNIDKKLNAQEKEFINEIISKLTFTDEQKKKLLKNVDSGEKHKVDYSLFKNSPDESIGLLVDLTALAKRDGEFNLSEKLFIKQVGAQIGFSEKDIVELMEQ